MSRRLLALPVVTGAYVAVSALVGLGRFRSMDNNVYNAANGLWFEPAHIFWQLVAFLGGLEFTAVLAIAMAVWLWRTTSAAEALALLAYPAMAAAELVYKLLLTHPGPVVSHGDAPSVAEFLASTVGAAGNSFPSGHASRAVLVYGLLAFLIARWHPGYAMVSVAVSTLVIVLVAVSRVYLEVHWESDVIGGLLLGSAALLAATVWLDRRALKVKA